MKSLAGRYALITGGSHGIGLATAKALAEDGCAVAICSRSAERLRSARDEIAAAGAEPLIFPCDVLAPDTIESVMEGVARAWGGVHILVNNVGGGGRWGLESIEDTEERVWSEVHEKNAMAAVRFARRAIPFMRREKWGRVVTVSSIYGKEGGGRPWFNMAKSAEISLMKSLALTPYLVRDGITFNTVSPGGIDIAGTGFDQERTDNPKAFWDKVDREYPLGRMGTPQEVAHVIAFVCSERASLLNGSNIVVDGGQTRSF